LKRRVELSPDNTRIPFGIPQSTHVCIGCKHMSCVVPQPQEVVRLENQLNAAITYLGAIEDDDGSEAMSSESSEEHKPLVIHDSEVIVISKNQIQSNTEDPADISTSTKETTPLHDREAPTDKGTEKSITRYKGILRVPSDTKRNGPLRRERTVRFCDQSSVRVIDAEPSLADRLAKARDLINEARNSRQKLVSATDI